jgi:hypothetical protein
VLLADLRRALLSARDLTRHLSLELATVNPSFHSCSPWFHCLSTVYDMFLENLPFFSVRSQGCSPGEYLLQYLIEQGSIPYLMESKKQQDEVWDHLDSKRKRYSSECKLKVMLESSTCEMRQEEVRKEIWSGSPVPLSHKGKSARIERRRGNLASSNAARTGESYGRETANRRHQHRQ